MNASFSLICSTIAIALAATTAQAGEVPIDISALANEPWTYVGPNDFLIINGSTFPTGAQDFGGVPFVIPVSPNNYWGAGAAANFGAGTVELTIPVGVAGVTSVFTVMNTMWGWVGPQAYVFVTFRGSAGAVHTVPLVGNVSVRDYNNDGNTNTIDNTSTIQVWDNGLGQRLDRQEFILPAAFGSQTLTSVTITDTGNEGNGTNGSRAVLAAVTVSTCHAYPAEGLTISSGPIIYDPRLNVYGQKVSLKNVGTTAIAGPLFFILQDLAAGVSLVGKAGETGCIERVGSPYLVPLAAGESLAPNTSVDFRLVYSDPSAAEITYKSLTAVSLGGRP